jgi:hypothetical protein
MKRPLVALICGACTMALVAVPAIASTVPSAQVAKKCKKAHHSAAAAKKRCKKPAPTTGGAAPTPPTSPAGTTTTTPPPDPCTGADSDGDGHGDACDACPNTANPGGTGCPATIYEVSQGAVSSGSNVRLINVLVAAVSADGNTAWVQHKSGDPAYDSLLGLHYDGLKIDLTGVSTSLLPGDRITVDGIVGTQSLTASTVAVNSSLAESSNFGSATASDFTSGNPQDNGVVVQLSNQILASHSGSDWVTGDGITISHRILGTLPPCPNGHTFPVILGIADLVGGQLQLLPTPGGVSCDHELLSLDLHGPSICVGQNGNGTVSLTTPAASDTNVTLQSGDAGALQVPGTATVPTGMSSGNFQYTAVSEGTVTVTASLNGIQVQDQINVLTGC